MNPKERNDSGWKDYPTRFATPATLSIVHEDESFRSKLRPVAVASASSFDECWIEFRRRCAMTNIRRNLVLDDLIWDIQANRWPKRKKKR